MAETLVPFVIAGLVITVAILIVGLVSMFVGGPFNQKYGNLLMRMRIFAQAGTLILFVILMYLKAK